MVDKSLPVLEAKRRGLESGSVQAGYRRGVCQGTEVSAGLWTLWTACLRQDASQAHWGLISMCHEGVVQVERPELCLGYGCQTSTKVLSLGRELLGGEGRLSPLFLFLPPDPAIWG